MRLWLSALFALGMAAFGEANPDAVRENQRVTVEMFPELGIKDSPLNKRFVERVQKYRTDKAKLFESYDWPYRIAEECVAELKLEQNVAASLEKAYRSFPELKIEGSPLQKLFSERSKEYLELHTSTLVSDDWPYLTAQRCSEELRTGNARTAPNSTTLNSSTDGSAASRISPSQNSHASVSAQPAQTKADKKSGGVIIVAVLAAVVALLALARSPANFFGILADTLGLGSRVTPQTTLKRTLGVVSLCGLACIGAGFIYKSAQVWLTFAGAIPIAIFVHGFSTSCESCRGWWAKEELRRRRVDSFVRTRRVQRKREHKDRFGNLLKTETWHEDVPVQILVCDVDYKCSFCGVEHTERQERER